MGKPANPACILVFERRVQAVIGRSSSLLVPKNDGLTGQDTVQPGKESSSYASSLGHHRGKH